MKKVLSLFLSLCVLSSVMAVLVNLPALAKEPEYSANKLIEETAVKGTYDYFLLNDAYDSADNEIVLNVEDAKQNPDSIEWILDNANDGRYFIKVSYMAIMDTPTDSECSLLINGAIQYNEISNFILPKEYKDSDETSVDIYGNQITPDQFLSEGTIENYIYDFAGVYSEPLSVNLNKGNNSLVFNYPSEELKISKITLVPAQEKIGYQEYKAAHSDKTVYSGEALKYEGEDAILKSDTVLYPISDKTSPLVSPIENGKIILNSIGGGNWKTANQYIKWQIDVPQSGLYTISIKYKQNQNIGQQSRRALYINGEIPFKEAADLVFDYSSNWKSETLGKDGEFLFYLEKGKNEIKLQSTLGETAEVTRAIDNCVTELNEIYRKLLVVLGSEPDLSKDYKLDKSVPEVLENMVTVADRLDAAAAISNENSKNSATVATLETISRQLRKMNDDSDEVPSEFSYFKTNIGSLGTCQAQAKQQPLLIDYYQIGSAQSDLIIKCKGNFFQEFWFDAVEFLCSFVIDYKNIGALEATDENTSTITAWITSGRDQSQIMRSLISEDFTPKTGNRVKLELVNAASLLPATVAGIGPDVAIGLNSASIIDYSMRNAAYDLKKFDDFEEYSKNFYDASFIPLKYMGGIYGIPMSMSFNVLYYRKDILEDLNLQIPETWNDVVAMSSVLSVNNMSFGLPSGNQTFLMMLRQKNLEIYSEDGAKCLLDTADAIDVFKFYTNFYNNYGFPITYSLVNRFRTGETPIAVDSIAIYNSLEISAPEIKGLWDFTVVPGFEDENGNVNHNSIANGTSTMLLANTDLPNEGWEFIKWWSSAEIQSKYGIELESRLGSSGRYTSANKDAIKTSCWNKEERQTISQQIASLSAVEQVPGSYYLTRNLDNAFRNAVYYDKKPMDVMFDYVYKINSELTEKRNELGLNVVS